MRVACPNCGESSRHFLSAKDYNHRIDEVRHLYYRCRGCGLIFLSPVPENLSRYYPPGYYFIPASLDELKRIAGPERYKVRMIRDYVPSGNLLEIGPACGNFVCLAKDAGFHVDAIEMDRRCCDFLINTVGIRAIQSSDIGAALKDIGPYDVVALWHVIEHLPDPLRVLKFVADKVRPGGILVVAAPNPCARQFRWMGRFWPHLDAPRHLCLIPPRLLEVSMASSGMNRVLFTTCDEGGAEWNVFGWQRFFMNMSGNKYIKHGLAMVGGFLGKALRRTEVKSDTGSTYTMIFRKDPVP